VAAVASETIPGVSSNSKDKERGVTTVTGADRSLLMWGPLPVELELEGAADDIDAAAGFRFVFVFMDFLVIGLFWILIVFNRLYGLVLVVLLLLLGAAAADEAAANL